MRDCIKDQIDELARFSRKKLLHRWQELYGKTAPSGLRRELMIPFLAYRIQEKAYGGLSSKTRAQLKSVLRNSQSGRSRRHEMKVGTQFIRRCGGATHVVSVIETGFEYRGKNYRSLSEIARLITGTRWSGPAFFGLTKSVQPSIKIHAKRPH